MTRVTEQDLKKEAEELIDTLIPKGKATIIGLYGDLGAGKTTFTKVLAEVLGVKETVTSPTFVLEKIYKLDKQKFSHLIHIDAYRLDVSSELEHLGWDIIMSSGSNLIVVEWADKIEDMLPKDTKKIYFKITGENEREISYD